MCVVVEGSGLRTGAAKNKLTVFFFFFPSPFFCWKMFQLSEFSHQFSQAARVGVGSSGLGWALQWLC